MPFKDNCFYLINEDREKGSRNDVLLLQIGLNELKFPPQKNLINTTNICKNKSNQGIFNEFEST